MPASLEPAAKRARTDSPLPSDSALPFDESLAYQLLRACEAGDERTAKALIDSGAVAWYQGDDETGWTALHFAASALDNLTPRAHLTAHGNAEFITYLLRHGGVWNMSASGL